MLLLALACLDSEAALDPSDDLVLARILTEESAPAFGVLAFLNDSSTSLYVLDHEVGLDLRAARSLIHHRDGPDGILGVDSDDLYDSIAEVDEQYFVGASALDLLVDHCRSGGWIPEADEIVGTWDGVSFTLHERDLTVGLANKATVDELDHGFGLDTRAVESILAARPMSTLSELSELYYVGAFALDQLKYHAVMRDREIPDPR